LTILLLMLPADPIAVAAGSLPHAAEAGQMRGPIPLDERGEHGSLLYLPRDSSGGRPAVLLVLLHGAGGSPRQAIEALRPHADRRNMAVLAPKSAAQTWDLVRERQFGEDLRRLDAAIARVSAQFELGRIPMAIAGFSDGASYALSLGIAQGARFPRIIAFSPGFLTPEKIEGRPEVFISHGREDTVLPIGRTSRKLVPRLRAAGYDVRYVEFGGGHLVPPSIARQAMEWLGRDFASP
jgi:predicted esterase